MSEFHITIDDDPDAFEMARRHLDVADIPESAITGVNLTVQYELDDAEYRDETAEIERQQRPGHGNEQGSENHVIADTEKKPEPGKVRRDTIRGGVLYAMRDGEWYWRQDLADQLDYKVNQVGDAMTSLLGDGYLERRQMNPQPELRGKQSEYRIRQEVDVSSTLK